MITVPELSVEDLQRRVLAYARQAVERRLISENRLAILVRVSQPHLHHVLAGKRTLRPALADEFVRALGIHLFDLYTLEELRALIRAAVERGYERIEAELEETVGHGRSAET